MNGSHARDYRTGYEDSTELTGSNQKLDYAR